MNKSNELLKIVLEKYAFTHVTPAKLTHVMQQKRLE